MRPELRETSEGSGQWRLMPTSGRRRWYKKYSQVFDMTLDPAAMRRVKTFAGVSLAEMLGAYRRDQYGQAPEGTDPCLRAHDRLPADRHLPFRDRCRGLGTIYWTSWGRLMPLTPEAAAQILPQGAAGLGRDPGPQFLQGAYLTAPGQRFYHIEVPGEARPRRRPRSRRRAPDHRRQ